VIHVKIAGCSKARRFDVHFIFCQTATHAGQHHDKCMYFINTKESPATDTHIPRGVAMIWVTLLPIRFGHALQLVLFLDGI